MKKTFRRSEQSIRKYIRFLLSIEEPTKRLHQTLTFKPPERDEAEAQKVFVRLMDDIFYRRPGFETVGAVYFRDVNQKDGQHYHVNFYFFDRTNGPFYFSKIEEGMRRLLFEEWNNLQGGRLRQTANRLIDRTATPYTYLLKKLRPVPKGKKLPREKARWWGVWHRELFEQNRRTPSKEELQEAYRKYARPRRRKTVSPIKPQRRFYTRANIEALRQFIEDKGKDWQTWARKRTGLIGDLTDEQIRENFNEKVKQGLTPKQITGLN